uniref:Cullin-associated NEDD8-dissociated protein 1 n=1 Tax=Aegilops tauschii TaxID=37682 RepID=M8BLV3_AEGTA
MANMNITGILEKMTGKDKDYRYMATSDLLSELNKESFKADQDLESKLTNIVLQQLEDASGDVSGLAVKCLAPLVKKVSEDRVVEMTDKLCDKLLNGKEQHRDIASIALKTIIVEVTTASLSEKILVSLSPQLIIGVTSGKSAEIKCECLDILGDVLHRFGNVITKDHAFMLTALLTQLSSTQASVRKKSVTCIVHGRLDILGSLKLHVYADVIWKSTDDEVGPLLRRHARRVACQGLETALESFMLRCPRDISPYCDGILNLALEYVSYDPNYTDSMEEDTDDEVQDEEDDDESANEYTDDEDASWKVRRASAKCLSAIIVSRPQMLSKMYQEACPKLIDRFRGREENVKMDIFNTFIELLRQTGNVTKGQGDIDESSPRWLLKQEVPKVVKSINRQLREKSIKTKVGAFSVLKELVVVLPDCLADHFGSLVPGIEKALNDKSSTSNLKIEALAFTRIVMASHSPSVFHPYIQALSGPILSAIGDRYYKVTAEALRVCGELVRVLRPNFEEVKECAISCMSLVIATFGDGLQSELPSCLPILVDRMGNEITRLTAVKAFAVIANSPLRIDLSCVLDHVVSELTAFLRKANRALRQATLGTLNSLVVTYGGQIGSSSYETIIAELSTLISDIDLHMAALALELCCTIMVDRRSIKNVGLAVRHKVLPQALVLIRSALLQGQALQALQKFFASLVQSANTSFETLLDSLISTAKPSQSGSLSKQALSSIAQCVAVLCLAAGDQKCASTVEMLKGILNDDSSTNSAKQHMALLCLGEIGRRKDLSNHVQIENIVIESFQSPFEEIKSAASYALGNIAVGNLSKYLPFILDQIDNQQKKQYLLLHSLKEVIARQSVDHTGQSELQDSNIVKILALLFNHCESEEEGVRNVVAECLGKIALIEPNKLIPALKERTCSPAANTRATVAIAIKYSIVERPGKIDAIMYSEISTFLMLIKDSDRHVRRAAVLALSTAAHNKPNLIKGLLPELLPLLYDQTVVKQELIRTVDLGPFKHVVDDGLELRKAAFECVDTLLDSCLDQLNPSSFIVPFLLSGLGDHYDVKMPCHLILSKLADKCPSAVLAVLDSLVEPLEKTIVHRPKGDAVKQEIDRNEDMIRSALRAIAALSRISGSDYSMKFKNLMNKITATPSLAEKYNSIASKVIPNRLKVLLLDIVLEEQFAFVPERFITDNIITAYECLYFMKRNKAKKHQSCALKLDMMKTYDRVEWPYLRAIMLKLGFNTKWVDIVMNLVSLVNFSVLFNGKKLEEFKPSRGIR